MSDSGIILLLGLAYLFLRGKKKDPELDPFFEWRMEGANIPQAPINGNGNGRNGGNGRTSYYVTTPYPTQDAISRLIQAERTLFAKSAVSSETKKEVKGVKYGYGERAYNIKPTSYEEERALILLDRA